MVGRLINWRGDGQPGFLHNAGGTSALIRVQVQKVFIVEKGDRGGVYGGTSGCDDLESASQTIYNKTGKYGYMAYSHDQIGYWNFVYQNGGQILRDDGSEAMYTEPATSDAIKYYVGLQENDWCPTQEQFANTGAAEMFFSGQEAMYYAGNWDLANLCATYPDMLQMQAI